MKKYYSSLNVEKKDVIFLHPQAIESVTKSATDLYIFQE